jgi:hypothetical protein
MGIRDHDVAAKLAVDDPSGTRPRVILVIGKIYAADGRDCPIDPRGTLIQRAVL